MREKIIKALFILLLIAFAGYGILYKPLYWYLVIENSIDGATDFITGAIFMTIFIIAVRVSAYIYSGLKELCKIIKKIFSNIMRTTKTQKISVDYRTKNNHF